MSPSYHLRSPAPSQVTLTNALRGVGSGNHYMMFRDSSNYIHIARTFGGGETADSDLWWMHYINTNTQESVLIQCGYATCSRGAVFSPSHGKLFLGSEYVSGIGSYGYFDIATQTWTTVKIGTGVGTAASTSLGSLSAAGLGGDNRMYNSFSSVNNDGCRCYSYDPSTDTWVDYGIIYNPDNHAEFNPIGNVTVNAAAKTYTLSSGTWPANLQAGQKLSFGLDGSGFPTAALIDNGNTTPIYVDTVNGAVMTVTTAATLVDVGPFNVHSMGWGTTQDTTTSGVSLPGIGTFSGMGLAADTTHIYGFVSGKNDGGLFHLMTHPIGSGGWTELTWEDGDSLGILMRRQVTTGQLAVGRVGESDSAVVYYALSGGAIGSVISPFVSGSTDDSNHVISEMDWSNPQQFYNEYGWNADFFLSTPIPGTNPNSTISYWIQGSEVPPSQAEPYVSSILYTGSYFPLNIGAVGLTSLNNTVYPIGGGYSFLSIYNYIADTVVLSPGGSCPATYGSLSVPAASSPTGKDEIYALGYANQALRWVPGDTWTNNADSATYLPTDAGRPNPYLIRRSEAGHYNYLICGDYDVNGLIWLGGNALGQGQGTNYGGVTWYNPSTGANDEMFSDIWNNTTGWQFRNLCASNNRSKIVVSGKSDTEGYIYVIDCATKTREGSYNLGASAWMVEVSNDAVLGVIPSTSQVFLFKPSDRTMIVAPTSISPASGYLFGLDEDTTTRHQFKLEKGSDGYGWVLVNSSLYRINPVTCAFSLVTTVDRVGIIKWGRNNEDLFVYYGINASSPNGMTYFPGLLQPDGRSQVRVGARQYQ